MDIRSLVLAVMSTLVLTGCWSNTTIDSTDVNEDKLFGTYRADFDQERGELNFFAQFAVGGSGGTTVRLNSPSRVTVDGEELHLYDGDSARFNLIGTYYFLNRFLSAPANQYSFIWTRNNGQQFSNTLTFAKPVSVSVPAPNVSLTRGQDIVVQFAGEDLRSDESLRATLTSEDSGYSSGSQEYTSLCESITSGHEVRFRASDTAKFKLGPAKLVVIRSKTESAQQGHPYEGGTIDSSYQSRSVRVMIENAATMMP